MYIYLITNNINGKVYVGQSQKIVEESTKYFGSGKIIKRAIKKYGKENFSKTILVNNVNDKSDLDKLEIDIIESYKGLYKEKCYNIGRGGEGGNSHQYSSEEEKRAFSEKMSKLTSNENNGMYGKTHSDDVKKLCGSVNIGNKYCEGHILSESTKAKISKSNKGKKRSKEVCLEISKRTKGEKNPMFDKKHSEKTILSISKNISKSKEEKMVCPHCGKSADLGNYNRWHGDNCKMNPYITEEQLNKRKPWNNKN